MVRLHYKTAGYCFKFYSPQPTLFSVTSPVCQFSIPFLFPKEVDSATQEWVSSQKIIKVGEFVQGAKSTASAW
jgi:hypothetical protein